ncbi:MAG: AAA family ATPase [Candidatus Bipolaricaulota bacterium]
MRLDKLTIGSFKNLRDFSIDFDEQTPTTVLVGRNGTGKSNLLEALTIIFRDLDAGEPPQFPYLLEYLCRGRKVRVSALMPDDPKDVRAWVDGKAVHYRQLSQVNGQRCLPNFVFGYYSGPSNRMEEHFEKHADRFYAALLHGSDRPLRPLFYARPIHSQFVLLAFFLKREEEIERFLREHLRIEGLESVLFVMSEPPWRSPSGDGRFWNARGVVSQFLNELYRRALAPLRLEHRVSIGFRRTGTREHLYLYLKDVEALRGLAEHYGTQQELFKALESTYISELISEVRIRVKARNVDESLTFRELSEGEQQLLMVLGLLRFTKEDESLFLLDEPDTHLNPAWSLRYLEFLRQIAGTQENSHIIMTTHEPLTIAGLGKSQVQIMQRDEQTGRVSAMTPDVDPKGMGVNGLLKSELFGLRTTLDVETVGKLDRRSELYALGEERSAEQATELTRLSDELSELGFASDFRDPYYAAFVKAMARHPQFRKPTLTPHELAEQEQIAAEALDRIVAAGGKP